MFDSCPLLEGVVDIVAAALGYSWAHPEHSLVGEEGLDCHLAVGSGKYVVVRHYIELEVADHIDSVHQLVGS